MKKRSCDCGDCRYCNAYLSNDNDGDSCWRCQGAGCGSCEVEIESEASPTREDLCAGDDV